MFARKMLYIALAGVLGSMGGLAWAAGPLIHNNASEIVGSGAVADPLIAVESSRAGIIDRLMSEYGEIMARDAIDSRAVRDILKVLRADQLLAASLVNSLDDLLEIARQPVASGPALQRYVSVAPTKVFEIGAYPGAQAFLVRDGDALTVVRAAELPRRGGSAQLVGYFVPNGGSSTTVVYSPKDGSGTGPNSWIGYTGGGNLAPGSGSAVAAGTSNFAGAQGSMVVGGSNNGAEGISSLVIGGFDNRALAIDSLVGGGAGSRATGARSVVVGGGSNLASGQWSFVGGGGRQSGAGAAGAAAQDNVASGNFSAVVGGQGNRAGTQPLASVVGGHRNTASGINAFIGGGGCNTASSDGAVVGGGGQTSSVSGCTFGNTASGFYSFIGSGFSNTTSAEGAVVPGGFGNTASGTYSFAAGLSATASHTGSFVWSDVTGGGATTRDNEFVVKAAGGVNINSNRGIALNAADTPFITRAWDPFDGTAPADKVGHGRWGMFMEVAALTLGIPGDDVANKVFQVAKYSLNGVVTPIMQVNQAGTITISGSFGQNLTLPGASKGFGSQPNSVYSRASSMYWFSGGVHSDTAGDPGGGSLLASLTTGATATTVTGTFRAQAFTATSDRNAKTAFEVLSPKAILAKVASLPIMTWSYKNEQGDNVRHIGPVSQDFKRLFNVGYDDKSIATVDADGVALAAIKGLKMLVDEKDARIARIQNEKDARIAKLEKELAQIKAALGIK